jgi:hypothetical protein
VVNMGSISGHVGQQDHGLYGAMLRGDVEIESKMIAKTYAEVKRIGEAFHAGEKKLPSLPEPIFFSTVDGLRNRRLRARRGERLRARLHLLDFGLLRNSIRQGAAILPGLHDGAVVGCQVVL